jgi:hypothetical protein
MYHVEVLHSKNGTEGQKTGKGGKGGRETEGKGGEGGGATEGKGGEGGRETEGKGNEECKEHEERSCEQLTAFRKQRQFPTRRRSPDAANSRFVFCWSLHFVHTCHRCWVRSHHALGSFLVSRLLYICLKYRRSSLMQRFRSSNEYFYHIFSYSTYAHNA